MIVYERNEKNLVIPKSLGNFSTNGGGTVSGITADEAQDMIDASIDAYDADLQDDLNGIRTAVSGNTADISANADAIDELSGITETQALSISNLDDYVQNELASAIGGIGRDLGTLSASTENGLRAANDAADSAYTLASSAYTLASSAYTRGDSAYTLAETLSAATETALAGKQDTLTAGSGISIVNNVISCTVSGGSGGGIEKVASLPSSGAEGDIVWLEGRSETGYTFVKAVSDWESGIIMGYVNGSEIYYEGYSQNFGVWKDGKRFRRDANHIYGDVLGGDSVTVQDADSYSENTFPFIGKLFVYQGAQWMPMERTIEVDYDENPEIVGQLFLEIYTGLSDFSADWLVVRHKCDGFSYKREFKVYETRYYGMDVQASDSRGAQDSYFGYIWIETFRLSFSDWGDISTFGMSALVGSKQIALKEDIPTVPSIAWTRFGNDERGRLTYDADNDVFLYDSSTIPTGDTTTVYADLIDKLFTDYLISGGLIFDYICPLNLNDLTVIKNGVSKVYTHPVLSRVEMSSPVTIDGQDFYKEITYNYGEYVLTAYYGANDGNNAANLRMSTP